MVKPLNMNILLNEKKRALKILGPRTWCTKKHFGYRVVHHLDIF